MSVLQRSPRRRQAGLVVATFLAVVMAGVTSALYFTGADAKSPGPSLVREAANQTTTPTGTITVKKEYLLHGATKEIPTVTIEDGSQVVTNPTIDAAAVGGNDVSHSQWSQVTVEGGFAIVTETLDPGWTTASAPTISGTGCFKAAPGLLAVETLIPLPGDQDAWVPVGFANGDDCVVTFHNERETGTLIITKVKDTSPGVPPDDGSTFNGLVGGAIPWQATNIGFGESTSPIDLPPGTYFVSETQPAENGWTPVGWANWLAATGQCPTDPQDYLADETSQVRIAADETTHVCVMNTKQASTDVPNVALTKTDDAGGSVVPGQTFTWTVTATVTGGPTSVPALISDTLPSPLEIDGTITKSPGLTCNIGTTDFECSLASGAADGVYTIQIPVRMPEDIARCQSFTNTATIREVAYVQVTAESELVDLQTYSGSPASDTVTVGCGSVIVTKDYITHGGTKDVPVVHVEDLFDPMPAINPSGQNDATHSEWMPVQVLTRGTVSVWEDLDTTKWRAYAPPTLSGDCSLDTGTVLGVAGLQAIESEAIPQDSPPNTRVEIRIGDAGTCTVTFHNERLTGTIAVSKFATVNGIQQVAEQVGWHITASSAACGVAITQDTNAGGTTTFTVPAGCSDYVVSENTVNAPFAGYSAVGPSSVGGIAVANGGTTTVTFTNARTSFNPPQICAFGCTPLVVTTPTPRAVPPTPVPPTPTVAPPTAAPTNTPVESVAGEKTPGAIATPLPPSTGNGGPGGPGSNLLFALLGLVALSGGLVALGVGVKARAR